MGLVVYISYLYECFGYDVSRVCIHIELNRSGWPIVYKRQKWEFSIDEQQYHHFH